MELSFDSIRSAIGDVDGVRIYSANRNTIEGVEPIRSVPTPLLSFCRTHQRGA